MQKDNNEDFEAPEFHRDQDLDETGVSQVIIERFVKYRLPMLIEIKAEMDEGKKLTTGELEVISRLVDRAHQINKFVHTYPKYKELVAKIVNLLHEITEEALENERKDEQEPGS
jgi:hypothetical protein